MGWINREDWPWEVIGAGGQDQCASSGGAALFPTCLGLQLLLACVDSTPRAVGWVQPAARWMEVAMLLRLWSLASGPQQP